MPETSGWTVADLEDPRIGAFWSHGTFELIDGVLTHMPPAYFDGTFHLEDLGNQIRTSERRRRVTYRFIHEAEIVIDAHRVVRADALMITGAYALAAKGTYLAKLDVPNFGGLEFDLRANFYAKS